MTNVNVFENFNQGKLLLKNKQVDFSEVSWSKHLVTSKDTDGQFIYHLVRIATNKKLAFIYMKTN